MIIWITVTPPGDDNPIDVINIWFARSVRQVVYEWGYTQLEVSEWILLYVSHLTKIFLVYTFKSQKNLTFLRAGGSLAASVKIAVGWNWQSVVVMDRYQSFGENCWLLSQSMFRMTLKKTVSHQHATLQGVTSPKTVILVWHPGHPFHLERRGNTRNWHIFYGSCANPIHITPISTYSLFLAVERL